MSPRMAAILEALRRGPCSVDDLAAACGCEYSHGFSSYVSTAIRCLAATHGVIVVNTRPRQSPQERRGMPRAEYVLLVDQERVLYRPRCRACHCLLARDHVRQGATLCSPCEHALAERLEARLAVCS